jgi:hypothetical protein
MYAGRRWGRVALTGLVGGTLVLAGVGFLAVPVPGATPLLVLSGLGVLAVDHPWAARWARKLRSCLPNAQGLHRRRTHGLQPPDALSPPLREP